MIDKLEQRLRGLTPDKRKILVERVRERGIELPLRLYPLLRHERADLAENQRRLWFIHQLDPSSGYHLPVFAHLRGPLDRGALQEALDAVVARQQSMRMGFVADSTGVPTLRIEDEASVPIIEEHFADDAQLLAALDSLATKPFDLAAPPLVRARLYPLEDGSALFAVVFHHIISDGWSTNVFVGELVEQYKARAEKRAPTLEPLDVEFADVVAWRAHQDDAEADLKWREILTDFVPLELPRLSDEVEDPAQPAGLVEFSIGSTVSANVRELAQRLGVTPYVVVNTAVKWIFGRYADQSDVAIGNTVAARNHVLTEGLIGYFSTAIISRTRFDPSQSLNDLLRVEAEVALEMTEHHHHFPLEKIAQELGLATTARTNSFFDVMLVFQNIRPASIPMLDVTVSFWERWHEVPHGAMFDWYLEVYDAPDEFSAMLMFRRGRVDDRAAAQFGEDLRETLRQFAENPDGLIGEFSLASSAAAERGLEQDLDPTPFSQRFLEVAARTPDRTALIDGNERWSYRELAQWACGIAAELKSREIGPGTRVGVCAQRSAKLIAGLLGVAIAGAAYVPLEPDLPAARLAYLVEDSGVTLILCDAEGVTVTEGFDLQRVALDATSGEIVESNAHPLEPAYVIYTSGTTGNPKGVVVPHSAVANHLRGKIVACGYDGSEVYLCRSSFSFDASVTEIFVPLTIGGTLVIARPGGQRDPGYLAALIDTHQVAVMETVPSGLAMLLEEPAFLTCTSLRAVVLGGEALNADVRDRFYAAHPSATLYNPYGPTEATVETTMHACKPDAAEVTIGAPMLNVQTFVLDGESRRQPQRIPGQLFIAGDGLAHGYLGRPRLTAEAFLPCPHGAKLGGRMYDSGDRVAWTDGELRYLGRLDHQLQVRGVRVELSEIESVIRTIPGVGDVVVLPVGERDGRADALVAYVVRN